MTDLTKKQRRQVRELLELARERELAKALAELGGPFQQWRAGETSAHDLDTAIHEYHTGPRQKILKLYDGSLDHWELTLPGAVYRGSLTLDDFPDDLRDAIGARIQEVVEGLFRSME